MSCDVNSTFVFLLRGFFEKNLRNAFSVKICVSNFNALKGFICQCSQEAIAIALLCVQLRICWCIVSGDVGCSSSFLVLCGGFLTIHFNLITIRDELLLCWVEGEGRTILLPVCFASNSFKFFKLSEPLDINQIALWRGNLSGPAISGGFTRSFRSENESWRLSNR